MKIIVGTRGSKLALTQTRGVIEQLKVYYPQTDFEIRLISTRGDQVQDKSLEQLGDKGAFTREIEDELLNGTIDLAIHSMKDMPNSLPRGLKFVSPPLREDARDVLILNEDYKTIEDLPKGACIATDSKRRKYQLLACRADLQILPIRGNIDTRLRKLKEESLDGIVLAAAGLHRLGLKENITCYLPMEIMLPAPAQGALALEIRSKDQKMEELLGVIADITSSIQVKAERAYMKALNGGCHIPIGAYCAVEGENIRLKGLLGDEAGKKLVTREVIFPIGCEEQAGKVLAKLMRKELKKYGR